MALCVEFVGGVVHLVDPQPVDTSACVAVLAVPAELAPHPFVLTVEEGGLIGGAIMLLWASAFGLKMLRRSLDIG